MYGGFIHLGCRSIFRRVISPKGFYSERFLFRKVVFPKGFYSENSE